MSNAPSSLPRRFSRGALRLPLIAMLGAMTMGSGFGNPGCGGSYMGEGGSTYTPPTCDSDCDAMAGTYQFSFQGGGALEPGCQTLGMQLPAELVLSRRDTKLEARVGGLMIEGDYYDRATPSIGLVKEYDITLADGQTHSVRLVISGEFKAVPASAQVPTSFTGSYYHYRIGSAADPEGVLPCDIERTFTATR